jgi:hypothetical protein
MKNVNMESPEVHLTLLAEIAEKSIEKRLKSWKMLERVE